MNSPGPDDRARASGCLDDETLGAFLEGRLDPSYVMRIDGHAASCAACRELIALGARVAAESVAQAPRVGASVLFKPGAGKRAGRVGTMLKDKWRLDAMVGAGGMAEVYAGTHRNGKRVAIKILLPQLAVDPELCRRFVQEGYIANQIGHPGVVSVHDDDVTDDGAPFLVMDLLEGECISEIIARGRMPIAESVRVTRALLDILAAAHGKGVLHRDVKPANVFRTTSGDIRLLDFGIARLTETASTSATVTGATMGTPVYMPPEQARGVMREVDARSDVWAAGATLFSMLTGAKVRDGESNNQVLVLAATQPVPPTRLRAPWLSPAVADIVDRSLAFAKTDRYQSAAEMRAALASLPSEVVMDPTTDATVQVQAATYVPSTVAVPPPFTMMSSASSVPPHASVPPQAQASAPIPAKTALLVAGGAFAFVATAVVAIVVGMSPGRRVATVLPPPVPTVLPAAVASPPAVASVEAPATVSTNSPVEAPAPKAAAGTPATARGASTAPVVTATSAATSSAKAKSTTAARSPSTASASAPAKSAPASDPYDRRL